MLAPTVMPPAMHVWHNCVDHASGPLTPFSESLAGALVLNLALEAYVHICLVFGLAHNQMDIFGDLSKNRHSA